MTGTFLLSAPAKRPGGSGIKALQFGRVDRDFLDAMATLNEALVSVAASPTAIAVARAHDADRAIFTFTGYAAPLRGCAVPAAPGWVPWSLRPRAATFNSLGDNQRES